MICYRDMTFCASPACKNKCGRQLDDAVRKGARKAGLPISTMSYCDEKGELKRKSK